MSSKTIKRDLFSLGLDLDMTAYKAGFILEELEELTEEEIELLQAIKEACANYAKLCNKRRLERCKEQEGI